MAARHLEAEVRQERGVVVLDLRGEINDFAQEALDAAYAEAESNDTEIILLNFEEVDYINSTGIALIVGLLAKARVSKRRLVAFGLSDHYVEIFEFTRLSDFISVFPDEQSAVSEISAS
jgi:anti-sigma B factor antagonist